MDFLQLGFGQNLFNLQSMPLMFNSPICFNFPLMQPFSFMNFPSIFPTYNFGMWSSMTDTFSRSSSSSSGASSSADEITRVAASYIGNYDAAKAKIMFAGKNHGGGYCADFATFCAKKAYKNYPQSMVTSSPGHLRDEAKKRNAYKSMPSSDKVNWAKQNIKKGDLLIADGSGASGLHVVIANRVCMKNGICVLECYSGNDGGGVKLVDYPIEKGRPVRDKHQMLQGVINMEKFA